MLIGKTGSTCALQIALLDKRYDILRNIRQCSAKARIQPGLRANACWPSRKGCECVVQLSEIAPRPTRSRNFNRSEGEQRGFSLLRGVAKHANNSLTAELVLVIASEG
mmetsp:Transcript_19479/g.34091  ORF Transcript_19479/g.34091 Transcript_19479/m.34091 type:complete len:108 (+) Transcript_19479:172-495(+)